MSFKIVVSGSSRIHTIEYDQAKKELTIIFMKGGKYRYLNVPKEEFEKFRSCDSVGIQFNEFNKNSYKYEKLN